jgi:hypothetical protein
MVTQFPTHDWINDNIDLGVMSLPALADRRRRLACKAAASLGDEYRRDYIETLIVETYT